ncbi:hypothetical protein CFC21_049220, partial [Triticum aestivum]
VPARPGLRAHVPVGPRAVRAAGVQRHRLLHDPALRARHRPRRAPARHRPLPPPVRAGLGRLHPRLLRRDRLAAALAPALPRAGLLPRPVPVRHLPVLLRRRHHRRAVRRRRRRRGRRGTQLLLRLQPHRRVRLLRLPRRRDPCLGSTHSCRRQSLQLPQLLLPHRPLRRRRVQLRRPHLPCHRRMRLRPRSRHHIPRILECLELHYPHQHRRRNRHPDRLRPPRLAHSAARLDEAARRHQQQEPRFVRRAAAVAAATQHRLGAVRHPRAGEGDRRVRGAEHHRPRRVRRRVPRRARGRVGGRRQEDAGPGRGRRGRRVRQRGGDHQPLPAPEPGAAARVLHHRRRRPRRPWQQADAPRVRLHAERLARPLHLRPAGRGGAAAAMGAAEERDPRRGEGAGVHALRREAGDLPPGHQGDQHTPGRGHARARGGLRAGTAEPGRAVAPDDARGRHARLPLAGVRAVRAAHREERRVQLRRAGAGGDERPARAGPRGAVRDGAGDGLGVDARQGRPDEGGAGGGSASGGRVPGDRGGHGEVRARRHPVRARHGGVPPHHAGGAEDAGGGRGRAGLAGPAAA